MIIRDHSRKKDYLKTGQGREAVDITQRTWKYTIAKIQTIYNLGLSTIVLFYEQKFWEICQNKINKP